MKQTKHAASREGPLVLARKQMTIKNGVGDGKKKMLEEAWHFLFRERRKFVLDLDYQEPSLIWKHEIHLVPSPQSKLLLRRDILRAPP